ncbi:hypothetical protein QQ056_07185 [Oscillatoria laete-virens NRMC-F 0139]|nr:hypothetical protein [Oscillatoria laete-virens]MDL5053326.1 hypothetical protein [Oscillatoria laete-virens NRMC-F 0139]
MPKPDSEPTPTECFEEITTLLATALVRISPEALATLSTENGKSMVISEQNNLDECEKSRLHGRS